MLKVNLLPPYIHQKKKTRAAIAIVSVLLAAEVGGLLVYRMGPAKEVEDRRTQLQTVQSELAALPQMPTLTGATQKANSEMDLIGKKLGFMQGLLTYNRQVPDLYTRTAGYTYREVMFLNLEANASQLKFDAYVSSPTDVSRMLLGLSRNTVDFDGLPQVSAIPAWSPALEAAQKLEAEIAAQAPSTIIGQAPGTPGAYGSDGMSTDTSGSGGGGGGGAQDLEALRIAASRLRPKGFKITVTCALKNPARFARPSFGSSEQQLGGSGGSGGGSSYPSSSYPGGSGSGGSGGFSGGSGGSSGAAGNGA